jgi:uncharacterized protein YbjQ (UPF0145 family)
MFYRHAMTVPESQSAQPLPESARARLAASSQGDQFFTSDLSVNEFVLVEQSGFEPLGLVMGSSMYHIGVQTGKWSVSQELQILTQAMYNARELAMARMESEADELGADGVVGVRLLPRRYAMSNEVLEFLAVGTAIKSNSGQSMRTPAGRPFTAHLTGQDFWTLWQHGWLPRSMVLGTCVYHVAHLSFRQVLQQAGQNKELNTYTQAIYDGREIAMARMQHEGKQVGANGIVGVKVEEATWGWGEHAIEFFALGTAVSRVRPDAEPVAPTLTMPLS